MSFQTNVQPERLFPSNKSIRFVGVIGGSLVCASKGGTIVADANTTASRRDKNDFMRQSLSPPGKNDKAEGRVFRGIFNPVR